MTIQDGLLLFEEQLHDIILDSDSHVLVEMLHASSSLHFQLKNILAKIMQFQRRIYVITHSLQEGN